MKWTNDPQNIQKTAYEAAMASLEAARKRLDEIDAAVDRIEALVRKFEASERSDDGAAAPTEAREAEVRKMITYLVDYYRRQDLPHFYSISKAWERIGDNPERVRGFVENDTKYQNLVSIYEFKRHNGR